MLSSFPFSNELRLPTIKSYIRLLMKGSVSDPQQVLGCLDQSEGGSMEEEPQKILIADDEVDIREMLMFTFESKGFLVYSAKDAEEALAVVEKEDVDAVISDIRMPKGGGPKLLTDLKARDPLKPKVILITGYRDANMENDLLAGGAEAVLSKPVKLSQLVDLIGEVLPGSNP